MTSPLILVILCSINFLHSAMAVQLIVGTYTEKFPHVPNANAEGIYVYNLTSNSNGSISLSRTHTIPNVANPTFLEITRGKKYFYAVTESGSMNKSLIHAYKNVEVEDHSGFRYLDS